MSAPQIYSILNLPTELLTLVPSYLGKSVVPFRRVCSTFRDVSPIVFEIYKNKFFADRYGTRAECEKDIPDYIVAQRIGSAAAIKERLKKPGLTPETETVGHYKAKFERHLAEFRDLWLDVDASQVPRLVKYEDTFFKKEASFLERMKTKYRFYRREFHRERDEKVNKLIRLQNNIATEICYKPFNSLYSLQDLRDRCRRLQILEEERESLSNAMKASHGSYNDFLSKLRLVERVFFFVISWVHSWFQKPYAVELKIFELPENFETLNKKGVKLGETKITFQGQEIPVEIKGHFSSYDGKTFSQRTVFAIYPINDQSQLGCFGIQRKWTHIDPDGNSDQQYFEGGINPGKDINKLENPRLYIQYFENKIFQQDSTNGDRPIMRLLTQIAVEVLQLEAAHSLEIRSNHSDADVYMAGGFASLFGGGRGDKIKHDIQKAREEENKLFPAVAPYRSLGSFDVYLGKSPSNPLTRFVTKNEKDQEQSAMVDFDVDHPPITWEEQINAHRLLPAKGPILPKLFLQDFSRFEAPPQRA